MGGYTSNTIRDPVTGQIIGYQDIGDMSEYKPGGVMVNDEKKYVPFERQSSPPLTIPQASTPAAPARQALPQAYEAKQYAPNYQGTMMGAWKDPATGETKGVPYRTEGTYQKVGTFMASRDGVDHIGTLWQSPETGSYQFVDPNKQVVMSGSSGAPLPKLKALTPQQEDNLAHWRNWDQPEWRRQAPKETSYTEPPAYSPPPTPAMASDDYDDEGGYQPQSPAVKPEPALWSWERAKQLDQDTQNAQQNKKYTQIGFYGAQKRPRKMGAYGAPVGTNPMVSQPARQSQYGSVMSAGLSSMHTGQFVSHYGDKTKQSPSNEAYRRPLNSAQYQGHMDVPHQAIAQNRPVSAVEELFGRSRSGSGGQGKGNLGVLGVVSSFFGSGSGTGSGKNLLSSISAGTYGGMSYGGKPANTQQIGAFGANKAKITGERKMTQNTGQFIEFFRTVKGGNMAKIALTAEEAHQMASRKPAPGLTAFNRMLGGGRVMAVLVSNQELQALGQQQRAVVNARKARR